MNGNLQTPAPVVAPRRRRNVFRLLMGTTVVLAALVAAAPTLVSSVPALRDALIRHFAGNINGTIVVDDLSIGWFSPLTIDGLKILPPRHSQISREPLLQIRRIETERGLWDLVWNAADLGTVRIERPDVFVRTDPFGNNYGEVFGPAMTGEWPKTLDHAVRAQVIGGTFRWDSYDGIEPWQIGDLNAVVGVRTADKAASRRPELFVERGKLLDREELSAGLCNDLLKYAAPIVADATRVQGNVTIEFDDWRLPWGDFAAGDLSGRLVMHSVEVGPGPLTLSVIDQASSLPLVGQLIRDVPIPKFLEVANEQVVPFKMLPGGKIYHENLRFSALDFVDLATSGTVGLDETIDLTLKFGVRPPNADERYLAVLRQLASQTWTVQIRGTLGEPKVDLEPLFKEVKAFPWKIPQDWAVGNDSLGSDLVDRLGNRIGVDADQAGRIAGLVRALIDATADDVPPPPAETVAPPAPRPPPPSAASPPAPRRRILLGPPPGPSASPTSSVPGPRRPLLRRGVNILLDAAEEVVAPQPVPSATTSPVRP